MSQRKSKNKKHFYCWLLKNSDYIFKAHHFRRLVFLNLCLFLIIDVKLVLDVWSWMLYYLELCWFLTFPWGSCSLPTGTCLFCHGAMETINHLFLYYVENLQICAYALKSWLNLHLINIIVWKPSSNMELFQWWTEIWEESEDEEKMRTRRREDQKLLLKSRMIWWIKWELI